MKVKVVLLINILITIVRFSHSQQILLESNPDTLFPVINSHIEYDSYGTSRPYHGGTTIFNIASSNGKYYIFGDFTNISENHGPSLVIDTLTKQVKTPKKWRINGRVLSAIPDGQGGFYIGGLFSKIGDSTRKYLAQIDKFGKPTNWNPFINNYVTQLLKRNDTLFISGYFTKIGNKNKTGFAAYSISGDSSTNVGTTFNNPQRCFLISNDTAIFQGVGNLWKLNIKNNTIIPFNLSSSEQGGMNILTFSKDSSVIIYTSIDNGNRNYIKGVNRATGTILYKLTFFWSGSSFNGKIFGLKIVGDKAYVVGHFTNIDRNDTYGVPKSSFAVFNPLNGLLLNDNLPMTGYPSFIEAANGKLYISGKFTSINGVIRENFAVIDTGSYTVNSWNLSPTDAVNTLAFSNESVFVSGFFNGVNSFRRNGLAAFDSATGSILPWSPIAPNSFTWAGGKKFIVKGDTAFVLGYKQYNVSCNSGDYSTEFKIYNTITGLEIPLPSPNGNFNNMTDFIIEGNDLYATFKNGISKFSLPSLLGYGLWGGLTSNTISKFFIISDTIYSIGDNRFSTLCHNLYPSGAVLMKFKKSTGQFVTQYIYSAANVYYDKPTFENAVFMDNKAFVNGSFTILNDSLRTNFVCININDGKITNWQENFNYNNTYSTMKSYNGKIWLGNSIISRNPDYSSLNYFDTITGNLAITPLITFNPKIQFGRDLLHPDLPYSKANLASDFIFNNHDVIAVGSFDSANGKPVCGIVRFKINSSLPYELTDFSVKIIQNSSVLTSWKTNSEINVSSFDVERSQDINSFRKVGTVYSNRNGGLQNYRFIDKWPLTGISYYRLKVRENDGKFSYSQIKKVNLDYSLLSVYPNPVSNKLTVRGQIRGITFCDLMGRITLVVQLNNNSIQDNLIDISRLKKGIYFLTINYGSSNVKTEKIIVQ